MSFRPVDEDARERARRDHGTSLVVKAGAGTGKTTLLVDRIEAIVRSGSACLDQIAAVTFTENAATTMKLRLRERLEAVRVDSALPTEERERASAALEVLERANVSTIHALCAAILQERPLDCGVVPGFRMADEAEADVLFAQAWEEWLGERLTRGDDVLLEALDREIPLEAVGAWGQRTSLRGLARKLLEQRDLEPLAAKDAFDADAARGELLSKAARAGELAATARDGDLLAEKLKGFVSHAELASPLTGSALIDHLLAPPDVPKNFGHRPRWPSAEALEEAREIAAWSKESAAAWRTALGADVHGRLVRALGGVTALYERRKAERGVLDFLDLLVKARDALRDRPAVREHFHRRFRHVIIDEFQDTDRLQVEIARLLAGDRPGALVVVGDAKQSIYRFRRAEVRLFRELARERAEKGAVLHLKQNFRSRPAILRFVNRVFGHLIEASDEADQPAYEPIDPPPGLSDEPSVVALRFPAPTAAGGDDLLHAEAGALAAFLAQAARGAHTVRDPGTGADRPSRAGDVLVLTRRLTKVRFLEEAFEAAGLRFTVEGGKSFFDRQEVHETLAVLRAVDDPSDHLSLVAALRSSFFGSSDRDIVAYSLSGGLPSMGEPVDEQRPGAGALGPALEVLRGLHEKRTHLSVPALLERLYDETRILAALTGTRRGEAQVANLEKVATLARQAAPLGVLTLRGFANLLAERVVSAREEPDLPSTRPGDPDTVRVLSVHKAKGLEAPIVALYDTADRAWFSADTVPVWEEGRIAIGFREGCQPEGWAALVQREKRKAWAENRRLLYVACTRARDLLVVPRPPVDAALGEFWRDLILKLPASSDADVRVVDAETVPVPEHSIQRSELWALAGAEGGDAVAARWETERREQIAEARQRPFAPISATRLAAQSAPPPAVHPGDGSGRDFGSLVHRLLEWVSFEETGESRGKAIRSMAVALAPAFGLDEEAAARAAAQVDGALGLPVMERARRAPRVWREMGVWFPDGEHLVEGKVDLVFEENGQLVVVDYKSDAITDEQALAQAAHHAPQLQLYGRGLAQALAMPVRERLVVFTALARSVPV